MSLAAWLVMSGSLLLYVGLKWIERGKPHLSAVFLAALYALAIWRGDFGLYLLLIFLEHTATPLVFFFLRNEPISLQREVVIASLQLIAYSLVQHFR